MEDQPRFSEEHEEYYNYTAPEELVPKESLEDTEQPPTNFENIKQQIGNLFPRILSEEGLSKNSEQSSYSKKSAEIGSHKAKNSKEELMERSKNSNEDLEFTEAIFDKRHEIKLPDDEKDAQTTTESYSTQPTPISEVISQKTPSKSRKSPKQRSISIGHLLPRKLKTSISPVGLGIILAFVAFLVSLAIFIR